MCVRKSAPASWPALRVPVSSSASSLLSRLTPRAAWPVRPAFRVMTKNLFQSAGSCSDRDRFVACDPGYTPAVTFIYHIAEAADWEQALLDGQYTTSTRRPTPADEGVIPPATPAQVDPVAAAFYPDAPGPVPPVVGPQTGG